MVPINVITIAAHKETAKQAILKQLRESGAASPYMPGSVTVETDEAQAALAELLASGAIREARAGLYYLDPAKAKEASPGRGFLALLAMLIAASFAASAIALAASAG